MKELDALVSGDFTFIKGSIADKALINELFVKYKPQVVVNLAAQAGVRYSIENPDAYIESNLIGFYNILEACRHSYDNGNSGVEHLVYASSSSVYGSNKKYPMLLKIRLIIQFLSTQQPKNQMNCWHMHTPSYMVFQLQAFDFLQYMVRQDAQIWHILGLRTNWLKMR